MLQRIDTSFWSREGAVNCCTPILTTCVLNKLVFSIRRKAAKKVMKRHFVCTAREPKCLYSFAPPRTGPFSTVFYVVILTKTCVVRKSVFGGRNRGQREHSWTTSTTNNCGEVCHRNDRNSNAFLLLGVAHDLVV